MKCMLSTTYWHYQKYGWAPHSTRLLTVSLYHHNLRCIAPSLMERWHYSYLLEGPTLELNELGPLYIYTYEKNNNEL